VNGEGEPGLDPRELPEPLALKGGALDRSDLDEDVAEAVPAPRLAVFFSVETEADHSLSVVGEPTDSSKSSRPLLPVPPLVEADPEATLREDELAFMSFPFSFSLKSMNIRDRASLYAASRSSIVICFLLLPPVALLRPPILPDSDGSTSERSASSPATDPACD
jgi:hypothetical protein